VGNPVRKLFPGASPPIDGTAKAAGSSTQRAAWLRPFSPRLAVAGAVLLSMTALPVSAQPAAAYPIKPVTMVLPFGAGGLIDIFGRLIADGLSRKLGQPFIVRNMPGATGAIATEYVARAAPDGYTLLFASSAQTTSVPLVEKVNYRLEDLAPVSASGRSSLILAVNASVPAKTLQELVDFARANPGKLSYGSSGEASVSHLAGALFAARAGISMVHIPYKSGGLAVTDVMAGQIPLLFGNSGEVLANAKNERLRILAVSTRQRLRALPNVPTVGEALPGFELTAWQGTLVPVKTPRAIIDPLSAAIQGLSKDATIIERLESFGIESTTTTPEQMAAIIKAELPVYTEAVKAAGLLK
jgi:tripartite-type tricarboxylate transporter receptor subunit TctC